MGHGIIGFCSALGVLSISPENKPAVPVGYHTPCRSAQRELNVSGILPRYVRATTNTIFNTDNKDMTQQIQQRQMNTQTPYLKLKEKFSNLFLVPLTLGCLGINERGVLTVTPVYCPNHLTATWH